MAEIRIEGVRHSYFPYPSEPSHWALKRVDHVWRDGGAYALLGPSGCGKTSMLNIISGLVQPSEGRILFGGVDMTDVPTERRNIAQVFQFPVIYDTMTVRANLAFPLRNRRVPEAEAKRRVEDVAEMLDLGRLLDRRAASLSAAEKQTISLGRGLVRPDVAAILFDEPLTVIDPQVKFELRRKLKAVHEHLKLTMIYVTHDQNEALTFADTIVIMYDGEVVQVGPPEDLYERPQHSFVGYFIGSPGMNLLPARIEGDRLAFCGQSLAMPSGMGQRLPERASLQLGVRPGAMRLVSPGMDRDALPARVEDVERLGPFSVVDVRLGDALVKVKVADGVPIPADDAGLVLPPDHTLVFADDRLVGALA
ncbi:carbohydrate ABC transporter ATP-binding protein, CUT1 family [Pseudoxanthobacter soli DSM 19599]|uniref:Carbohydrate ABC transporter ATP-binding protein, CUT1 family n=1 Tax=Pseudoxanthobacter soli DSM 19599 TaxID=1123029 RepID=A0A1M7ZR63_9HYPH|nr:ABC transporter ATP-binding protein [Pseudoxanthobacter soli]SHO67390.1 carbohydrate ABC transporter ATP-binding protein, CUT1 family [Pseudoxanthobacter soli DSM 19599]